MRRRHIHFPDMPLHIVPRGRNRHVCFFGEDDHSNAKERPAGCVSNAARYPPRIHNSSIRLPPVSVWLR